MSMDTIEPLRKPFPVTEVPETPRMLHKLGRAGKSLEASGRRPVRSPAIRFVQECPSTYPAPQPWRSA